MKRLLLYALILGSLFFAPVERADVGRLAPVEVILMDRKENSVILQTDTGDRGEGASVEAALKDMKRRSLSYIYLDTAQYLLVTQQGESCLQDMKPYLSAKTQICKAPSNTDLTKAAQYLRTHHVK